MFTNENKSLKNTLNKNPESIQSFNDLAKDSYAEILLDDTFCVFESINGGIYLIYSNKNKSIISLNVIKNQKINEIKNAHEEYITNFRYYFDEINKRDLFISISASDNNIKLWNFNNFSCLLNLEKVNLRGELNSACFLNENNSIYIITSSYCINSEPIKFFDLNGIKIKELEDSEFRTIFIDTYYDKKLNKTYILTCNKGFVKSYDYINNESKIYKNSSDEIEHCSLIINDKKDIIELMESSDDGNIRIWNFHSGLIIKIINCCNNYVYGITLWNEKYLFVGCEDEKIKLIDIDEGKIIKDFNGHDDSVLTIKTIVLPHYGKCLISSSMYNIKLWK